MARKHTYRLMKVEKKSGTVVIRFCDIGTSLDSNVAAELDYDLREASLTCLIAEACIIDMSAVTTLDRLHEREMTEFVSKLTVFKVPVAVVQSPQIAQILAGWEWDMDSCIFDSEDKALEWLG